MKKMPKLPRIPLKYLIIILALFLFWPLLFGGYYAMYNLYRSVDPTQFPAVSEAVSETMALTGANATDPEKGAALLTSVSAQLQRELDSPFGWSANDAFYFPTKYLDNRANRQRGVIFATRMLTRYFSTHLAKLGQADPENEHLKEVREKHIVYGAEIWGFFRASAEKEYKRSIELMDEYKAELADGKATFNARTDDIYNNLTFIDGEEFLGQVLGSLVQANDEVSFWELDDRIKYAQGVVLVVRDYLTMLVHLYPEIVEKGGEQNVAVAFKDMDRICTFDPLIVLRGDHDSLLADHRGKMARYFISMMRRLEDLANSLRS